jgi:transcriptional regulator with XRE-family HTH domain
MLFLTKKIDFYNEVTTMPYTEKLVEMKRKSGLSTQQTADLSGVPLSTITRMLSGQTEEPTFSNIAKVVKTWGGSLDELVGIEPKTVTVTKTETVYADERMINLYERAIASKNRWIKWLFVLLLVLVFFFIGVLIFDVITPDTGWYQEATSLMSDASEQILSVAEGARRL